MLLLSELAKQQVLLYPLWLYPLWLYLLCRSRSAPSSRCCCTPSIDGYTCYGFTHRGSTTEFSLWPHSPWQVLRAVWNDTLFLSSINVMDYSLLVGMEQRAAAEVAEGENQWTLVVGVIDYCRQYTWKEEAETRVKRGTVIPPKQYKRRFRDALHRYFMASIDKYATDDGRIETAA